MRIQSSFTVHVLRSLVIKKNLAKSEIKTFYTFYSHSHSWKKIKTQSQNSMVRIKIKNDKNKTRSIQRMQTPPHLWPYGVTLSFCQGQESWSVIRCRLLYCTLEPGMMSMGLILYKRSLFVYSKWPLTFICDLQLLSRSLTL